MKNATLMFIMILITLTIQAQAKKHTYTYNDINIDSIDVKIVQLHSTITTTKYGFVNSLKFGTNTSKASGNYHWKNRDEQILKVDGEIIDMNNYNPAYILNILYECGFKLVGQSSNQDEGSRTWIYYTLEKTDQ